MTLALYIENFQCKLHCKFAMYKNICVYTYEGYIYPPVRDFGVTGQSTRSVKVIFVKISQNMGIVGKTGGRHNRTMDDVILAMT